MRERGLTDKVLDERISLLTRRHQPAHQPLPIAQRVQETGDGVCVRGEGEEVGYRLPFLGWKKGVQLAISELGQEKGGANLGCRGRDGDARCLARPKDGRDFGRLDCFGDRTRASRSERFCKLALLMLLLLARCSCW